MFVIHTKNQPLHISRLVAMPKFISKIIQSYPVLRYIYMYIYNIYIYIYIYIGFYFTLQFSFLIVDLFEKAM